MDELIFFVNGRKITETDPDPKWTLAFYLRHKLRLTGTKVACGEGGCGACTVMLSSFEPRAKKIEHRTVNACLAALCSVHGFAVTTTEGIGNTKTRLHPVQERLARSHGSQCGFCSPGMVMSMYTLLRNEPHPSMENIEEALQGNLCRCTGYRPILDGFKTFSKEFTCSMGDKCCNGTSKADVNGKIPHDQQLQSTTPYFPVYESTQEPIFPPELQIHWDTFSGKSLTFSREGREWYRPVTLKELLELKRNLPQAKLVAGNTFLGVEQQMKNKEYSVVIAATHIQELASVRKLKNCLQVGASVTLDKLRETLKDIIQEVEEYQCGVFKAIVEMLQWFGGKQVRNVASIGGNIACASALSDLNPLFMAAGCELEIASLEGGHKTVQMDAAFFQGNGRTALKETEVIVSVSIPFTRKNEYFEFFKQSRRKHNDRCIVNAGMRVMLEDRVINDIALAFGGVSDATILAQQTMDTLCGRKWNQALMATASEQLRDDIHILDGAPRGMEAYRNTLAVSLFFKFYTSVMNTLDHTQSQCDEMTKRKAAQYVSIDQDGDVVGQMMLHLSAEKHTTGEAIYLDDIPSYENELHGAFVLSTKPNAKLVNVDASSAFMMRGVVDVITHIDVPGSNSTGPIIQDEEIFASEEVSSCGQIIGLVVAEDLATAKKAAKAVEVQYKELPSIITIEEAIEAKSFMEHFRKIERGNVDKVINESPNVLEGEMRVGGQEHFYLETHSCIAIPKCEDGEIEVISSTQNLNAAQRGGASALGVPMNRITAKAKRLGGGFGGKETRGNIVSTPTIVAANKLQRPIRCVLDRHEDMIMSGARHAFLGRYKVAFDNEGKVLAVDLQLYANCGHTMDVSCDVVEAAMLHVDNSYFFPSARVTGFLCKTNTPSSTAFRGFGAPQAMIITETFMRDIAAKIGKPTDQVQRLNLYREDDVTFYGQPIVNCSLLKCWDEVIQKSSYEQRMGALAEFNAENSWRKKGIALTPVKYGACFTTTFLNQAGALVNVYIDGSVLVAHSGTEMGQGLHTKITQVASRALGIPTSLIHINETSTATVPNASPTAASASSDLNGMAVMLACETILNRLRPYKEKNPRCKWEDWVKAAYFDRVSLSTTGFYRTPNIGFDWEAGEGRPFAYFTQGAACSEVEIDCLTGNHTVLRTDIVMDVGKSLNPAIDVGQIEGAFVQGYGMFTLEELRFSPDGYLLTLGPVAYKIPSLSDIPLEFNVSLLHGRSNPKAVYSSKAIGEPPLFLSASVFFAIKEAVRCVREEDIFPFNSPATCERIRLACLDQFTDQRGSTSNRFKAWSVDL